MTPPCGSSARPYAVRLASTLSRATCDRSQPWALLQGSFTLFSWLSTLSRVTCDRSQHAPRLLAPDPRTDGPRTDAPCPLSPDPRTDDPRTGSPASRSEANFCLALSLLGAAFYGEAKRRQGDPSTLKSPVKEPCKSAFYGEAKRRQGNPSTRSPKPETLNPAPYTLNPKPETPNPKT